MTANTFSPTGPSQKEILHVRVVSVPKKLRADRKSDEAWGKFRVLSGPRGGEEYWFTGPVFEMCKLLKVNVSARVEGEFLPKGTSGASRPGFHVCEVGDLTIAPDEKALEAAAEATGVKLASDEYSACVTALGVTGLQKVPPVVSREDFALLADAVGEDVANRFAAWCSWGRKWGADMLEGLFRACGLGGELDLPYIWAAAKALRFRAARNGVTVADLVRGNPYVLVQVWDDAFLAMRVATAISEALGDESAAKVKEAAAAAIVCLREKMNRGHSFVWKNILDARMRAVGADDDTVKKAWELLLSPEGRKIYGGVRVENDGTCISLVKIMEETGEYPREGFVPGRDRVPPAVYAPAVYWGERDGAELLAAAAHAEPALDLDPDALAAAAREAAREDGREMDAEQEAFVRAAALNKITVLVGEAGTGKTQAVKWLVAAVNRVTRGKTPVILAPTALAAHRAAERASGVASVSGSTIHRYAAFYDEDADVFVELSNGSKRTLLPETVIVDECSMMGPVLMKKLLARSDSSTRFIFVGDPMQLPPVGPGGVFPALVRLAKENTPGFGFAELTRNYRVEKNSEVYAAARQVRSGGPLPGGLPRVRVVYVKDKEEAIVRCLEEVEKVTGGEWPGAPGELLVLSPYRWKAGGSEELNKVLAKRFVGRVDGILSCPGTPVVACRNDYADGWGTAVVRRDKRHPARREDVYNGTPGVVKEVRTNGVTEVLIAYKMGSMYREAWYYAEELPFYVSPAYALTVHKAQGGEARHIILVMLGTASNRSLLYTAMTRCKDDPPGSGSVTIIALPEFGEAPYARPDWAARAEQESAADGEEEIPPPSRVLSGFYHRTRKEIWDMLPVYVPPNKGVGVWMPEGFTF